MRVTPGQGLDSNVGVRAAVMPARAIVTLEIEAAGPVVLTDEHE